MAQAGSCPFHALLLLMLCIVPCSFKLNVLEERSPDEASSPPSSSSSQPQQQPSAASMHIPDMGLKSKEHVLQNLRSLTEVS